MSDPGVCRSELLPNSCVPSLLAKSSGKKFGVVELGLRKKWRPSDDNEKKDGMTLWDQFKAEFSEEGKGSTFEQVQGYVIDLVTVSLGAYIALLLLSDFAKMRQMGLGML